MPSKVCPTCHQIVPANQYNRHRQAHQPRPTRQANGRHGSTRAWRKLRAQIILRDGGQCRQCGAHQPLEIHHIDGNWRNNNPTNLIVLCAEHHRNATAATTKVGGRG
jgi:5-methylcytosine-specific restriction endonuclease McrA